MGMVFKMIFDRREFEQQYKPPKPPADYQGSEFQWYRLSLLKKLSVIDYATVNGATSRYQVK